MPISQWNLEFICNSNKLIALVLRANVAVAVGSNGSCWPVNPKAAQRAWNCGDYLAPLSLSGKICIIISNMGGGDLTVSLLTMQVCFGELDEFRRLANTPLTNL